MSRIKKVDLDDWDKDLREMTAADSGTPLEQGAMRMFAHTPEISKGLTAFAGSLKQNRSLPDRLVELVRLRVAFHNQCRSCMAIRYKDGQEDGITEDLVCSLEKPMEADNLSDAEKAAIQYGELFATIIESKPDPMDSVGREMRDTVLLAICRRHSLAGDHCLCL